MSAAGIMKMARKPDGSLTAPAKAALPLAGLMALGGPGLAAYLDLRDDSRDAKRMATENAETIDSVREDIGEVKKLVRVLVRMERGRGARHPEVREDFRRSAEIEDVEIEMLISE